jgi:hypothetical protein
MSGALNPGQLGVGIQGDDEADLLRIEASPSITLNRSPTSPAQDPVEFGEFAPFALASPSSVVSLGFHRRGR